MKKTVSRINDRIQAYRSPSTTTVRQLSSDGTKDQQVSIRLYPFLLYRLDVLARHAHMSRSQLMLEILQDGAESIIESMDRAVRQEVDREVNERLENKE